MVGPFSLVRYLEIDVGYLLLTKVYLFRFNYINRISRDHRMYGFLR